MAPGPRAAAKVVLLAVVGGLSVLHVLSLPSGLALVLGIAFTALAYFVPDLLVINEGQSGFEAAMANAARNRPGPLAEELVRTLQDIQVGQPRRQAYEALAARNDVRDLRRFISAIIQADVYGIAVGDVLRTQAAEMRLKRRQRAEEKAMQVPVKVVFPLVFCILPVLFIVVMGPAIPGIMGIFNR